MLHESPSQKRVYCTKKGLMRLGARKRGRGPGECVSNYLCKTVIYKTDGAHIFYLAFLLQR